MVKTVAEKLGDDKTQVKGAIVSTSDLTGELDFKDKKQFQGVKRYLIDKEMSGTEIIELLDKFLRGFFALSFEAGDSVLKIKPKAPKSGKPESGKRESPVGERFHAGEELSIAERMQKSSISNIREAIGINEKFLFINELFNGDLGRYNKILDDINELPTKKGVDTYLASDLITFAHKNAYDTALLIAGDQDFIHPVLEVRMMGKLVVNAFTERSWAEKLKSVCDDTRVLNRDFLGGCWKVEKGR